jgi:hypothetical protein
VSRLFTRLTLSGVALVGALALAASPVPAQMATPAASVPSVPGAPAMKSPTLPPAQLVSPKILVARIDQNCGVYHTAIQTEKAAVVAEVQTNVWKVIDEKTVAVAEKTHSFTTYAKAWKQAGNYVWIHEVTTGSKGGREALQMCFRNDGTVMRVKQAIDIPSLDAASASVAYYRSDGSLIQKTKLFEENDPAIAKKIATLPFFKNLP